MGSRAMCLLLLRASVVALFWFTVEIVTSFFFSRVVPSNRILRDETAPIPKLRGSFGSPVPTRRKANTIKEGRQAGRHRSLLRADQSGLSSLRHSYDLKRKGRIAYFITYLHDIYC